MQQQQQLDALIPTDRILIDICFASKNVNVTIFVHSQSLYYTMYMRMMLGFLYDLTLNNSRKVCIR